MNVQTKSEALRLMACIIHGLGDRDRNVLSIQADALKAAVRTAKEASSPETCIAAAGEKMLQRCPCRAASSTHEGLNDIDRSMLSIDLLRVAVCTVRNAYSIKACACSGKSHVSQNESWRHHQCQYAPMHCPRVLFRQGSVWQEYAAMYTVMAAKGR